MIELTKDHRPDDPSELARITGHGGSVVGGRVAGKLAVSRSFGDYNFKRSGALVVDPDVSVVNLNAESEFLVVACDGLFESFQANQIAEFVKQRLKNGFSGNLAEELGKEAIELGSKDNVSLALIYFEPKLRKLFGAAGKRDKKDGRGSIDGTIMLKSRNARVLAQTTDAAPLRGEIVPDPNERKRKSAINYSGERSDDEISTSPRPMSSPAMNTKALPKSLPPPRPKTKPPSEPPVTSSSSAQSSPKVLRASKSLDDVTADPNQLRKSDPRLYKEQ